MNKYLQEVYNNIHLLILDYYVDSVLSALLWSVLCLLIAVTAPREDIFLKIIIKTFESVT